MKKDRRFTENENEDDVFFEEEIVEIDLAAEEEDEPELSLESQQGIDEELLQDEIEKIQREVRGTGHKKKPRRRMNKWILTLGVVATAICLAAAAVIIEKNTPSKKPADLNAFYQMDSADGARIILNYEITSFSAKKEDGRYYLPASLVQSEISDKFYYDAESQAVLYTTATQIYEIPIDSKSYTVDGSTASSDYVIVKKIQNELYIAMDYLKDKAGFSAKELTAPERVAIVVDGLDHTKVAFSKKAVVRTVAGIKGSVLSNPTNENNVWVVAADDPGDSEWALVATMDGRKGYVQKSAITGQEKKYSLNSGFVAAKYPSLTTDTKQVIVWHAVYAATDNDKIKSLLSSTKGITAVSPTWYKVTDASGSVTSFADRDYVNYIHSQGMKIWPLISDFSSASADGGWDEAALLSSRKARTTVILKLMTDVTNYGYDGLNIDFEKVPKTSGADFTQFIRELSIACRKQGIVLSIDNYVPRAYNSQYNRKAQGECADYVIVMGYDEHYSGDTTAGSVASIGFVEQGIADTIAQDVPSAKVINALPFYTRLWSTAPDESGVDKLTSKSYSMQGGADIAKDLGLNIVWDDTVKQNVAKGSKDNVDYSIWLEDEKSMQAKMDVVNKYKIGGVAAWSLGMETATVWDIINAK